MESAGCYQRVVFEKDGVFLHTSTKRHQDQDALIPGVIRLIEKGSNTVVQWTPIEESGDAAQVAYSKKDPSMNGTSQVEEMFDPGYEPDWAVISTVGARPRPQEDTSASSVKAETRGKWAFAVSLSELKSIRKSKPGLGWSYLIFITQEGVSFPALHFHQGGTKALLKALCRYVVLAMSPKDSRLYLVYSHNSYALSQSFDELQLFDDGSPDLVSRFFHDPYTATFGGFSKVTNFFRGALRPQDGPRQRPQGEMAAEDEPGFEVITCHTDLGQRPVVEREEPVSEQEWEGHLDAAGRVLNVDKLKQRIFKGGLSHEIRKEVWKFLLGYFPWDSTSEERQALVKRKADEYFRMKLQWKSVTEEQERRNSLLRGYRSLIERDVSRTDRNNKFYEGSDNPGLVLLNDSLMTYCMYNFDLGYVQGMSDLLSPILYVTQNEVDAFWCFTGFMEMLHHNFEESQEGMKRQLAQLNLLLRLLDPPLCDFLDAKDSGSLCFCFRWLLIWFKREFSFQDILRLWEVQWTGLPCPNFHLLVCCAILDSEREALMNSSYGLNEILKHINELTMRLNMEDILCRAEAIYQQLKACAELPRNAQELLGLVEPKSETPSTDTETSPPVLSPTRGSEATRPESMSPSQGDSSIEILATEDTSTAPTPSP
ncbi:TBC1 domain family member 17 [Latimeria chalumnae]|uniref:TBC1 domain family member 15 n=1 Tax=Latimeria chalumnae TaxID=7897 RepID=H3BF00_LATCH|nr:PREDICTED: TBC1 domain family member 17 [Latimeria chalumnae]|eukprot:XP_005991037.1 PREDICTED: TBC1 domain family member 17 [Latimeria chalumnae]